MYRINLERENPYTYAEMQAAADASRARAGVAASEDDDDDCWLYCPVSCFEAYLDSARCPHSPAPAKAEAPPAQGEPAISVPDATNRRIVEVLRRKPDSTAREIAARLDERAQRIMNNLRRHEGRLYAVSGERPNSGSKGGPRGRTWRVKGAGAQRIQESEGEQGGD